MGDNAMHDKDQNVLSTVFWTAGMLLVHCVAVFALLLALIRIVPACMVVFEDLDVELPAATQLLMSFSIFVAHYWYLLVSLALGVDAAVFIALSQLPSSLRWVTAAWFTTVLIAMILFAGFVAVALYVPLQNISAALS